MKIARVSRLALATLVVAGIQPAMGERISFDTRSAWQEWKHPIDAVDLTVTGRVQPLPVRKNTNAVLNAENFGGGIRGVGSNTRDAAHIIDGNPATNWSPDPTTGIENAWIEIDLGRLVTANKIVIAFDEAAPPFAFFNVLLSGGDQFFTNALVPVDGTLAYNLSRKVGFNTAHQLVLNPRLRSLGLGSAGAAAENSGEGFKETSGLVRVIRLEFEEFVEGAGIADIAVSTIGDNISMGLIQRGGSIELITDLQQVLSGAENMVDGDIVTNWAMQTYHQTQTGFDIYNRIIFDLGAHYWVDQVRIIGEPAGAPSWIRNRYANFFWYQLLASDGSIAPDGTLRFHEIAFVDDSPLNETQIRNFDHEFDLQKIRYIKQFFPSSRHGGERSGTHGNYRSFALISEFQIFGQGFPAELRLTSPIFDLKEVKGLTSVEWDAITPAGTRVEVRSRTGNEIIEELHYYDKKGKEITERKWNKTPSSLRGPTETSISIGTDWSIWSDPYISSGTLFASPSPRQYAQLDLRLVSDDPDVAPSISSLHLNVENPIALATRAEVFPAEVQPGVKEEFTYFVLPTFGGRSQGFNRLTMNASVPVDFMGLELGDEPIDAELTPIADGFVIDLPSTVRSPELIKLSFSSTIYQNQTRFNLFLGNRDLGNDVRQLVEKGDANSEIASESVSVQLPINGLLLANIALSTSVLTPNGDGIGDELAIEFDALKLVTPRPIAVRIYDLAGRKMRELSSGNGLAQRYRFTWDGRDNAGATVPPGTYLVQIEIEGDSLTEIAQRIVPVAY
ncbi:MAG: FlgD immunoglobulin-like domain containing protein [Candidatus Latescibacterota bacterium]|nr:FlgD immunoglobulin-like domain containing protein [Candidatus Latescibacterota bacterium]